MLTEQGYALRSSIHAQRVLGVLQTGHRTRSLTTNQAMGPD